MGLKPTQNLISFCFKEEHKKNQQKGLNFHMMGVKNKKPTIRKAADIIVTECKII
jgi:hypothetical protein